MSKFDEIFGLNEEELEDSLDSKTPEIYGNSETTKTQFSTDPEAVGFDQENPNPDDEGKDLDAIDIEEACSFFGIDLKKLVKTYKQINEMSTSPNYSQTIINPFQKGEIQETQLSDQELAEDDMDDDEFDSYITSRIEKDSEQGF